MSKLPFTFAPEPHFEPTLRSVILEFLFDLACGAGCLAAAAGIAILCAAVFS